ncbi:MAG TPA: sulfite exporter TauE/SafE family protein [Niabella sp.]|nr:sulfite exporter TauE/SafE family protein [Niabella sp.]HQW14219.1 sulfite exporter TauE/SafE family protein [Niabella sp.]HQX19619.1 sulfite exporter TauE/SafE family protein [Niabella sp.]HQX39947.1 sulfite exporter TauE/SafE family protein [Niabella sp.]HRB06940.1 sulfite exporter TauE/SafE family protein [Niabella sp.]
MQSIFSDYSAFNWLLLSLAAFFIGLSKAGLKGMDMLNITIMALVLGGKASTGVVLPLLCFADLMTVKYYHRHAEWIHFRKLIPWMIVGVLIGVFVGEKMNESTFRKMMAVIILITIFIMLFFEYRKKATIPTRPEFAISMGLVSGFTTMIGNLAGAFSNLYFLALRMSKNNFIGTAAWIFLAINYFKLPFQIFYWKNITINSLKTDLLLIPSLIIGFVLGIKIVALIKDDSYRKLIILMTFIGAIFIFIKK